MPADPGLQAERTVLAWQRSAVATGVNAALLLRAGWLAHSLVLALCGALMFAFAAGMATQGWQRAGALLSVPPRLNLHPRIVFCYCACAMLVCMVAAGSNLLAVFLK